MVAPVLILLAALGSGPTPGVPPAEATRIGSYQPDLAEGLSVISVDSQDARQPTFIAKRRFDSTTYVFFGDGRHQQILLDADHLITYLPARSGADGYLIAARGPYHTEIIAFRLTNGFRRIDVAFHVAFPNSNQAKAPGDFLLLEETRRLPRILVTDHQYGNGGAGAVLCFEVSGAGTADLIWRTDQPLFSNPRPLFTHRRSNGRVQVMADNRSHLAAIDPDTGHVLWNRRYTDSPLSFDRSAGFWSQSADGLSVRVASDPYNKFIAAVQFRSDGTFERLWQEALELGYQNQSLELNTMPSTIQLGDRTVVAIDIWKTDQRLVKLLDAKTGRTITEVEDARLVRATGDPTAPPVIIATGLKTAETRYYFYEPSSGLWRRYDEPLGTRLVEDVRFGTLPTLVRGRTTGKAPAVVAYGRHSRVYLSADRRGLATWDPASGAIGEIALVKTPIRPAFGDSPWGRVFSYGDGDGRHMVRSDGRAIRLDEPHDSHHVSTAHLAAFFFETEGGAHLRYTTSDMRTQTIRLASRLYEPYLTTGRGADGRIKMIVHNGQELRAFDADTATEEWRLEFSTPYQCSRTITWFEEPAGPRALVMFDREIMKIDATSGEVLAWQMTPGPTAAFIFRKAAKNGASTFMLADGNGAGLINATDLRWQWSCLVPEESRERAAIPVAIDDDAVLDLIKPWENDHLAVMSGATGEVLRTISRKAFAGLAQAGKRTVLLVRSQDGVEAWSPWKTFRVADSVESTFSSEDRAFVIRSTGSSCELTGFDDSPGAVVRLAFGAGVGCASRASASGSLVAVAQGRRVEWYAPDLSAQRAVAELPDNISRIDSDPAFCDRCAIALTETGEMWFVQAPGRVEGKNKRLAVIGSE